MWVEKDHMFIKPYHITASSRVSEIVNQDYRTAAIFRKHGIEYCCSGNWSLEVASMMKGIPVEQLLEELEAARQLLLLPNTLPFDQWDLVFLAEYIVHIHHYYLKKSLPEIKELLGEFVKDHREKYSNLEELERIYKQMYRETLPHLKEEEEVIFPYIRQIVHAFENHESYASLLVKTLRKPVESLMNHEHIMMKRMLERMRHLTDNYTPPEEACTNHRVVFARLKELDSDIVQHLHLEQDILFPKALDIEKELLDSDRI